MNEYLLVMTVPAAFIAGGGMVARMYHQTELALLCAASAQMVLVFGLMCNFAIMPEFSTLWMFILLVGAVATVLYWRRQFRTYDAQDFRDWLAKNEIPMDRLRDPKLHRHSSALCKYHPDEHLVWEEPETV